MERFRIARCGKNRSLQPLRRAVYREPWVRCPELFRRRLEFFHLLMPYNAKPSDGFVHVEWFGVLEAGDLQLLNRDLAKIGATLGHAPSVLHTFSRVKGAAITPWSMLQHALRRRDVRLPNAVRVAWVTTTAEVRRMGELFAELNRNPKIEIAVFASTAPAKAWLRALSTGTAPAKGAAAG